jgi:hypothetical protein
MSVPTRQNRRGVVLCSDQPRPRKIRGNPCLRAPQKVPGRIRTRRPQPPPGFRIRFAVKARHPITAKILVPRKIRPRILFRHSVLQCVHKSNISAFRRPTRRRIKFCETGCKSHSPEERELAGSIDDCRHFTERLLEKTLKIYHTTLVRWYKQGLMTLSQDAPPNIRLSRGRIRRMALAER